MPGERDQVDTLISVTPRQGLALVETLTLGLMVARKWDRADTATDGNSTQLDAIQFDNFTAAELLTFRNEALAMMSQHASTLPLLRRDRWSRGFVQGFVASWAYALSIALIALMIRLTGTDIITLLRELLKP
jgi:hypothetical protein